jgi:hypothetical protein
MRIMPLVLAVALAGWSVHSLRFLGRVAFREPPSVSSHDGALAVTLRA